MNKFRFAATLFMCAVIMFIAIAGLLFRLNQFSIEFSVPTGETDTVEYGSEYSPPDVKAYLKGKIFLRQGEEIKTEKTAPEEFSNIGTYKFFWSASAAGAEGICMRCLNVVDTTPPQITLATYEREFLYVGEQYEEAGYSAFDAVDGDVTSSVAVSTLDTSSAGVKEIKYTVTDKNGNTASAMRMISVKEKPRPIVVTPAPVVSPVNPNGNVIYLTFDDGPGPYTAHLLDILAKYNVKATFFVTGGGDRALIAREAIEGHSVAIHSLTHNYSQIYSSDEAFFNDINAMNEIINEQTGSYTNLLRFPGGSSNTVSKKYNIGIMTRITQAVEQAGYKYFDWNVISGDASGAKTAERVYTNVINGIRDKQNSIVLQHDIKSFSVNAVERIIIWGLNNGYTFAPLTAESPTVHQRINN